MLENFAVGAGASVADPIVAKLISADALLDLLQNGRPPGVFSDNAPSIEGLSSQALGNVWRAYTNSELGIARFFIAVPVETARGKLPTRILFDRLAMEPLQCGTSRAITDPLGTGNIEIRTAVEV